MENTVIIKFNYLKKNISYDLEVPLDITTKDLVMALNNIFDLGIDTSNIRNCILKVENPVVLMRGNKLLGDYGLRNGSIINFSD